MREPWEEPQIPHGIESRTTKPLRANDIARWVFRCRVVMPSPAFDDDLSLLQGVEDLSIQQLVSEPGVERLHIPVLPRRAASAARSRLYNFGTDHREPGPKRSRQR